MNALFIKSGFCCLSIEYDVSPKNCIAYISNLICFNKDSKRSVYDQIPSWIEQERAYAVASLKVCITW